MNIITPYQPRPISFQTAAEDYWSSSSENRAFVVAAIALTFFAFIGDSFLIDRYPPCIGFFVMLGMAHILINEIYSRRDYLRIIESSKQVFSLLVLQTNEIINLHADRVTPYTYARLLCRKDWMNQQLQTLLRSSSSSYSLHRRALQTNINAIVTRLQIGRVFPRSF